MGRRGVRNILLVLAIVGVICLIIALSWGLWLLITGYIAPTTPGAKERKEVVEVMASVLGGVVAPLLAASFVLLGFYITRRTTQFAARSAELAEQGRHADLFARAIGQLGATDRDGQRAPELRIGGIYTLERLAKLSAEDYEPIVGVLTAYVRVIARRDHSLNESTEESEPADAMQPVKPLDSDTQAALSVLSRISGAYPFHSPVDLSETDLGTADLRGGSFERANFQGTNLEHANLQRTSFEQSLLHVASLQHSSLIEANLRDAFLVRADLRKADLFRANLSGARLYGANLSGARLSDADLSGADLSGADLSRADLSDADLSRADLSDADLSNARLYGARLYGARLYGTRLHGTQMSHADLSDAILTGTLGVTNKYLEQQASSLARATMPTGQKYEDWLKDEEDHSEDGETSGPS